MKSLILYASLYHNYGFNLTHIVPSHNAIHKPTKNPYKAASNPYDDLHYKVQCWCEVSSFDWKSATGVGIVMGYRMLRAIDIDGCNDLYFVHQILHYLGLPADYEWVILSGSGNGYHVYLISDEHPWSPIGDKIRGFKPNSANRGAFRQIELRWRKHLVAPPSLTKEGNSYQFANGALPLVPPRVVSIDKLRDCVSTLCDESGVLNAVATGSEETYNDFIDFSPHHY